MIRKKGTVLLAAALSLLLALSGCAGSAPAESSGSSEAPETVSRPVIENSGKTAALVLGELAESAAKTEALSEIARKYEADYPNTKIEVRSYGSPAELEAALRAGEADIVEVRGEDQPAYAAAGLLENVYPYLQVWEETSTFTQAAKQIARSLGVERTYILANGYKQDVLYYRIDWFKEYNAGVERDSAQCRTWDEIAGGPEVEEGERMRGALQKLGDRGRLALAGKDKLADYFDTIVWSTLSLTAVAHTSAAYFLPGTEGGTIFSFEKTLEGVDQFLRVTRDAALPGAEEWTEEQALQAFLDGEAGMLLADRSVAAVLEEKMPEGSWATQLFPRGRIGASALACDYSGWGVSTAAKDRETAIDFLFFLSNSDNNTHYAQACRTLPIHMEAGDMEPELATGELAAEMEMIRHIDWFQYSSEPVVYAAHEGYRELANGQLRRLVRGEITREELLAYLDDYWNRAFEQEGVLWKDIPPEE